MFIKGTGIKSLLQAIEKQFGAAGLATVLERVPEEIRKQLEPVVLSGRMYPVEVSAGLQRAIWQTIGRHSWQVSYELGIEAGRIDFGGIYRVFLRVIDFDTLLDRTERAFRQYNSQGHARWLDRTRTSATAEVVDVSGFNDGIWHSIAGRYAGLLLLCGAKRAEVKVVESTATSCRFVASWST